MGRVMVASARGAAMTQRFGAYRVVGRLGRGGMCEVFLAEHVGASGFVRRVAIKALLPEWRGQPEHERLLIREAMVGAELDHPNIARALDLGVEGGHYYLVMEHVPGADLRALTAQTALPRPLALWICAEVALALDHMHRACDAANRPLGLIHRDVSLSNILIATSGRVALADLGIAKATRLAETTQGNVRRGTYAYMSPEQVLGKGLGPASDQFSLGIVLVELLTGQRPFEGEGAMMTMERIQAALPPALPTLPASLRALALTCLMRDPTARHADMRAVWRALMAELRVYAPIGPPDVADWLARTTLPAQPATQPRTRTETAHDE
jgi:eukaryotic-like serine/threonine-protein kinase